MNKIKYLKFLFLLVFISCVSRIDNNKMHNMDELSKKDILLYTIDSCEYIGFLVGYSGSFLSHKGNCKYSQKRSSK